MISKKTLTNKFNQGFNKTIKFFDNNSPILEQHDFKANKLLQKEFTPHISSSYNGSFDYYDSIPYSYKLNTLTLTDNDTYIEGETLHFENNVEGYFSNEVPLALKVVGKTHQDSLSGKNLFSNRFSDYTKPLDYYICPINLPSSRYTARIKLVGQPIPNCLIGIVPFGEKYSDFRNNLFPLLVTDGNCKPQDLFITSIWTAPKLVAYVPNKETFNNIFKNYEIQLEEGKEQTSYEPYCGGMPTPNPDYPMPISCVKQGTKIHTSGKNLFGGNILKSMLLNIPNRTVNDTDKTITYKAEFIDKLIVVDKIFKQNTQYTFIFTGYGTTPAGLCNINIYYTDGTIQTIIGLGNGSKKTLLWTTLANKTVDRLIGNWNAGYTTLYYEECGIFEGVRTLDDFEAYAGNTITTPCDLYDGDIWYPMTGNVVKNSRCITFKGNENFGSGTSYYAVFTMENQYTAKAGNYNNTRVLNSYVKNANATPSQAIQIGVSTNGYKTLFNVENITEFKALLAQWYTDGNPFKVVYPLYTPITEQYEPQPIFAPVGTVSVTQQPAELTADLQVITPIRYNLTNPISLKSVFTSNGDTLRKNNGYEVKDEIIGETLHKRVFYDNIFPFNFWGINAVEPDLHKTIDGVDVSWNNDTKILTLNGECTSSIVINFFSRVLNGLELSNRVIEENDLLTIKTSYIGGSYSEDKVMILLINFDDTILDFIAPHSHEEEDEDRQQSLLCTGSDSSNAIDIGIRTGTTTFNNYQIKIEFNLIKYNSSFVLCENNIQKNTANEYYMMMGNTNKFRLNKVPNPVENFSLFYELPKNIIEPWENYQVKSNAVVKTDYYKIISEDDAFKPTFTNSNSNSMSNQPVNNCGILFDVVGVPYIWFSLNFIDFNDRLTCMIHIRDYLCELINTYNPNLIAPLIKEQTIDVSYNPPLYNKFKNVTGISLESEDNIKLPYSSEVHNVTSVTFKSKSKT